MRKVFLTLTLICCLVAVSCRGNGGGVSTHGAVRDFPMAKTPSMLGSDQDNVLNYLSQHFWDAFASEQGEWLCDSTHIAGVETTVLEEQVGTYTTILGMLPFDKAVRSVETFFSKIEDAALRDSSSNIFDGTISLMKRYLYDPNSPVRFEDAYGALASCLARSECVDPDIREIYASEAGLCSRNRTGTPVADFLFTDSRGKIRSLYGIGAPYTILFFSNPGCEACAQITKALTSHLKASDMVKNGQLAIVSIYIDEDLEEWRAHLGDWPDSWICGYDHLQEIRDGQSYFIRAIPSVYVLDSQKNVILKDATTDKVLNWIDSL